MHTRVPPKRIALLDELRGLLVLGMVLHHVAYTLGYLFDIPMAQRIFDGFGVLHPIGAGLFVALCGFCCRLSRNNGKRGALLLAVACGMTVVLWLVMPENCIWFGALHCLAVCILLYALLEKGLRRVPLWCGLTVCAVLLCLTWHLPPLEMGPWNPGGGYFGIRGVWEVPLPEALTAQVWLYPLGLGKGYSADYFPLFPWMFVFFAGSFLGRLAPQAPHWMSRSHVPFLSAVGKKALWIYLLHQPGIYGVCWLVFHRA